MFFILFIFTLGLRICLAEVFISTDSINVQKPIVSWIQIRDKNLIRQEYDYSCGSASLATILAYYYHIETSEKEILDAIFLSKGITSDMKEEIEKNEELRKEIVFSFFDIDEFVKTKGMRAIGLALDMQSLFMLKTPVIIYVKIRDNEHFTVYKGSDKHFVYLADPSFGNIRVSLAKFKEMFYQRKDLNYPGKVLAIVPNDMRIKGDDGFMKGKNDVEFIYKIIKDTIGK
ncbi:peptidase C39 [Helicobacter muridarum]|uniref:Peptidase C39 n=2 Tax=Helicobacter muridarum TaxID=216 RepID=A0A4V6I3U9_9HELI|nr:peptidase C39 [Helicobacter muridarum]